MQLGELQHQIERFNRRSVAVLALSVDKPKESLAMIRRLGITFHMGSDPEQTVAKAFRVQNPDTQELALHAVYIVDRGGQVIYRKVALRRPTSNELIDAIDAYRGDYPVRDAVLPRRRTAVAYPDNNFQAILEASRPLAPPDTIDPRHYEQVRELAMSIHSDDALIAYRGLLRSSTEASLDDLLNSASLLARQTYFPAEHKALAAGARLRERLDRVAELEAALTQANSAASRDTVLDQLTDARALLTRTRAIIANNAQAWRLRLLKTSIRSYREVARAVHRDRVD